MREITTKRDYEDNVSVTINDNKMQFLLWNVTKPYNESLNAQLAVVVMLMFQLF